MFNIAIGSLLIFAAASLVVSTGQSVGVESIAKKICSTPEAVDVKLTSISGFSELVNYLDNLPAKHELVACRSRYIDALRSLQQVLTQSNENVCSDEKISLIEDFDRKHVSAQPAGKGNKESIKLPRFAKMFYTHYAMVVGTICHKSLLEGVAPLESQELDVENTDELDKMLQEFSDTFALDEIAQEGGYNNLLLPWKMIDYLPIRRQDRKFLNDVVDDTSDAQKAQEPFRVSVKTNGAEKFRYMQHQCRTKLKPNYARLSLPVIRLANLGFHLQNNLLSKQINENSGLKRLFRITQLCETILPIQAFQDSRLKEGKVVVIKKREAAKLAKKQPVEIENSESQEVVVVPVMVSLADFDNLDSVLDEQESNMLIETIENNRATEKRIIEDIFKALADRSKANTKSRMGKFFSFRKSSSKTGPIEVEIESLSKSNSGLSRSKRSPKGLFIAFKELFRWFFIGFLEIIKLIGEIIYKPIEYVCKIADKVITKMGGNQHIKKDKVKDDSAPNNNIPANAQAAHPTADFQHEPVGQQQ